MDANHSNCNLKYRRAASISSSRFKLRAILLMTTLPAGSTPRHHCNSSSSSHRGLASGWHGWVVCQHGEIGGTVTGTLVEVEIDVSTKPALKLTIYSFPLRDHHDQHPCDNSGEDCHDDDHHDHFDGDPTKQFEIKEGVSLANITVHDDISFIASSKHSGRVPMMRSLFAASRRSSVN